MSNDVSVQYMLEYLNERIYSLETAMALSPPIDQPPFHDEIRIINAIAERVREMTAVEYFETQREMFAQKAPDAITVAVEQAITPRRAVEIVQKWKGEHNENQRPD